MAEKYPKRKRIRLREFDYNSNGAYFITICTKDREQKLSHVSVGTTIGRPPTVTLTRYGVIVEEAILQIPNHYPMAVIDNYVIMPNHIHIILRLDCGDGRAMLVPTISQIVQQMKGYVSKRIGHPIWQRRFYDHVIRNESDYRSIWEYIDNNPARWTQDEYYTES